MFHVYVVVCVKSKYIVILPLCELNSDRILTIKQYKKKDVEAKIHYDSWREKKPINIGKEMQIRYYEVISIKRGMNKDELKSLKLIIARVGILLSFFVSVCAIVIRIIDRVDRNTEAVEVICMSHSLQVE